MRHLDLFSGIGGFALAARNVGWETVAFCEPDEWCQRVLAKHWPGVPIFPDIRKLCRYSSDYEPCPYCDEPYCDLCDAHFGECECEGAMNFDEEFGQIDIITGGFPCQDISSAGTKEGIEGKRSGLWTDLARVIGVLRPRYAVLENVSALLARGLDRVAGDLAEIGYDCIWHCIPASAVGAPHRRDRVWVIAYPHGDGWGREIIGVEKYEELESKRRDLSDGLREAGRRHGETRGTNALGEPLRDESGRLDGADGEGQAESGNDGKARPVARGPVGRDPGCQFLEGWQSCAPTYRSTLWDHTEWWATEPDVGRVAHGVPSPVDRLRGLGNAIVPQVVEMLFRTLNGESGQPLDPGGPGELWPTPAAHEGRLGWQDRSSGKKGYQKSLSTAVMESVGRRPGMKWK
jgi:DNA (cytosine-5)-methyltransferase 1